MTKSLEAAAEAFCPRTWSNDVNRFDTYEWELRQKAFKAGATWAIREDPEVKALVEALEFYANGMAFGHDGKNAIELQRFEGMAHVVYAGDPPSMAKPPVKIGTAAREALAAYRKSIGGKE